VIFIVCFDPLELDLPGCLANGDNSDNSATRREKDLVSRGVHTCKINTTMIINIIILGL
jgi:hypothetical protein